MSAHVLKYILFNFSEQFVGGGGWGGWSGCGEGIGVDRDGDNR
jgi:hypothetical protein